MQQLGEAFIGKILLPFILGNVLGNIEKDDRLQQIFRYDIVVRPEVIDELKVEYAKNTFFERNPDLNNLLWDEFIYFVKAQKEICAGNLSRLAERMLPIPGTKDFAQTAWDNYMKFSFQYVKAVEKLYIDNIIKAREASGKINKSEAGNLRDLNENGEIILVRTKKPGAEFDIVTDKEIQDAQANVEKQAGLFSRLFSEKTEKGEKFFLMNPPKGGEIIEGREQGNTLSGMQMSIWESKKERLEKKLRESGFYIEKTMEIDKNGIITGIIHDKKTNKRIEIKFDILKPEEKGRRFRFRFIDEPRKQVLWLDENRLNELLKESALAIYEKERRAKEKGRAEKPPTGKVLITGAGIPAGPLIKKRGVPTEGEGARPVLPELRPVSAPVKAVTEKEGELKGEAKGKEAEEEKGDYGVKGEVKAGGVMKAKGEMERRMKEGEYRGERGFRERMPEIRPPYPEIRRKKSKFGRRVAYLYAALGGAGVGLPLWWALFK